MPFAEVVFSWCPKCGSQSLACERPGVLACGACGLRFFINVAAAVAAVLRDRQGRVLFVRRSQEPGKGLLDLPGGFVEAGESGEEAIRREMREELGIELTVSGLIASAPNEYEFEGITYRTLDLFFECASPDLARAAAREEIDEMIFTSPHEVGPAELAFASVRRILPLLGRG